MSYINADGLQVITFKEQGEVNNTGATVESGVQTLVITVEDASTIPATADTPAANDAFIPAGAVIKSAMLVVDTAFASAGSATLNIGTYTKAGTAVDADGIDAAIALTAIDAANDVVLCDGAQVGSERASFDMYVEMDYDTAAFTAGAGKLVIEYLVV